jgi:hypothetical protein
MVNGQSSGFSFLEVHQELRRMQGGILDTNFGGVALGGSEIRVLISNINENRIYHNINIVAFNQFNEISGSPMSVHHVVTGKIHVKKIEVEKTMFEGISDLMRRNIDDISNLHGRGFGVIQKAGWQKLTDSLGKYKQYHQTVDIGIKGDKGQVFNRVDIDDLMNRLEKLLENQNIWNTLNLSSVKTMNRMSTLLKLTHEELESYIKTLTKGAIRYEYVTEDVYYNHTNLDEAHRAILGLSMEIELPDYIMSSSGDSSFMLAEEYREEIKTLILNSPQYVSLQYFIETDQVDLAIDTYISRRVTGGYSLLDTRIQQVQGIFDNQRGNEISYQIFDEYGISIHRYHIKKWQEEMYLHVMTGLPLGMKIANPYHIFRYIPIEQPEEIIAQNEKFVYNQYFTSYYPMILNLEDVVDTSMYQPGSLESLLIKTIRSELGIHTETYEILDLEQTEYSEHGLQMDSYQTIHSDTMREIPVSFYYMGYNVLGVLEERRNLDE